MTLSLAYVPVNDVPRLSNIVKAQSPNELHTVLKYFEGTYVISKPAQGRRKAVAPRYKPCFWNKYEATVRGSHKTNNVSDGVGIRGFTL